jgi:hypothetical protein
VEEGEFGVVLQDCSVDWGEHYFYLVMFCIYSGGCVRCEAEPKAACWGLF